MPRVRNALCISPENKNIQPSSKVYIFKLLNEIGKFTIYENNSKAKIQIHLSGRKVAGIQCIAKQNYHDFFSSRHKKSFRVMVGQGATAQWQAAVLYIQYKKLKKPRENNICGRNVEVISKIDSLGPDQVRQPPTRPMRQNKFRTCIFPYFFICRKDGEKKKILT